MHVKTYIYNNCILVFTAELLVQIKIICVFTFQHLAALDHEGYPVPLALSYL